MATIDPRQRAKEREEKGLPPVDGGERADYLSEECKPVAAVVGWEHYESPKKGTPGTMIRFVVTHGPLKGQITERTIWHSWLDPLLDLALALGYEDPFDYEDDDHLERVLTNGLVQLVVKAQDPYTKDDGTEVVRYEPAFFNRTRKKIDDEVEKVIEAAEGDFTRYLEWRADNPRGSGGGSSSSSSSSSGGGGGGGRRRQSGGGGSAGGGQDDDIPF